MGMQENLGPLLIGLALAAGVVVLEAAVLALLRWAPFSRSLRHALVLNGVSILPGLAVAATVSDAAQKMLHLQPTAESLAAFAFAWIVTVAVEAPLLRLLGREPWMKCWRIAAGINAASSLALILGARLFGDLS